MNAGRGFLQETAIAYGADGYFQLKVENCAISCAALEQARGGATNWARRVAGFGPCGGMAPPFARRAVAPDAGQVVYHRFPTSAASISSRIRLAIIIGPSLLT